MAYRRGHWYIYGGRDYLYIGHGNHTDGPLTTDAEREAWINCRHAPTDRSGVYVPYSVFEDLIVEYMTRNPQGMAKARQRYRKKMRDLDLIEEKVEAGLIT